MSDQRPNSGLSPPVTDQTGEVDLQAKHEIGRVGVPIAVPSPKVLVGIPAYNEAGTIDEVITGASPYADEVLVVDDGSSDRTHAQARAAGAIVFRHGENQGYGATLGTIFQYAHQRDAEHLVIIDADGQHDVTDIPDLVSTQQETGAEIITGSRFRGKSDSEIPLYRRFGLGVINFFTNIGLRLGYSFQSVSDTQCGFRAYDSDAIESLATAQDLGSGMAASLDIIFQAAREGHDIVEVPTRISYDVENASTRNPVVHGLSLLNTLFISVVQDRPSRMIAIGLVSIAAIVLFVLLFGQFGVTALSLAVTAFFLLIIMRVTQSSEPQSPSDSTDP